MDPRHTTTLPAARYAELRAAGRADLDAFLRTAGPLTPLDAAGVFRVELERRWHAGDRVPVEHYLARLPGPPPDAEAAVDLIFSEFLLREQLGDRPDADEYARRFPDHAAVLRDQIALHRALAAATPPADGADPTATGSYAGGAAPAAFPRSFGRYTILRTLGTGGMGVVYLADDTQLGRRVALKVLRLDREGPAAVARFHREAKLAAGLAHPNLCPVFDVGRVGGIDYLTMPYLAGESLAERVRRGGPVPAAEAVRIVRRVADAVRAAHEAGVIHRDLKPANVLLDDRGEPVVTDFGLARRVAGDDPRLTASGTVVGTPAYMPPEQVGAAPEQVGPAADVYSLGVILYELLTGRVPFRGESAGEVLRQVLTADPPPPGRLRPGLDPRLEAVCLRALAKDPKRRFASMAAFAAALEAAASPRRGRRWRWAAGAAAAAALAAAGWAAWPPAKPPAPGPAGPATPAPAPPAPADLLQPGSRWAGTFRFDGDPGPPKPVVLTISERAGERFRGEYVAEETYRWAVDGTLRGEEVYWKLSTALNRQAEETGATGKAYVTGRCAGREMRVTFHDPTDKSRAEMTLTLRE